MSTPEAGQELLITAPLPLSLPDPLTSGVHNLNGTPFKGRCQWTGGLLWLLVAMPPSPSLSDMMLRVLREKELVGVTTAALSLHPFSPPVQNLGHIGTFLLYIARNDAGQAGERARIRASRQSRYTHIT